MKERWLRLLPAEIDLFIAVDGELKQSLIDIIDVLNIYHQLGIKRVTVESGSVTTVRLPFKSKVRRIS